MKLHVTDNFLSLQELNYVKQGLNSTKFPWYKTTILSKKYSSNFLQNNNLQFIHMFYENHSPVGNYFDIISVFLNKLPIRSLIKVKANLTLKTPSIIEHGMHTDFNNEDSLTSVYYLNTNDGYTLFDDGTKIESLENRIATFNVNTLHTGTTCTNSDYRIVINFNYF